MEDNDKIPGGGGTWTGKILDKHLSRDYSCHFKDPFRISPSKFEKIHFPPVNDQKFFFSASHRFSECIILLQITCSECIDPSKKSKNAFLLFALFSNILQGFTNYQILDLWKPRDLVCEFSCFSLEKKWFDFFVQNFPRSLQGSSQFFAGFWGFVQYFSPTKFFLSAIRSPLLCWDCRYECSHQCRCGPSFVNLALQGVGLPCTRQVHWSQLLGGGVNINGCFSSQNPGLISPRSWSQKRWWRIQNTKKKSGGARCTGGWLGPPKLPNFFLKKSWWLGKWVL